MPAALIEMGYLTNPQEENEMLTEDFQNRMASSILDGIKEALNLN
jgi:N-acetylmuramoyl-L-alanine amidase